MVKTRQEIYKELYKQKYKEIYTSSRLALECPDLETLVTNASRKANLYAIKNTDKEFYKQNKTKQYIVNVEYIMRSIGSTDVEVNASNKEEAIDIAVDIANTHFPHIILEEMEFMDSNIRDDIYNFIVKEIK